MSAELALEWRKVEVGMSVELKGKAYTITTAKTQGKVVTVTVAGKGGTFTREMRGKDTVNVARKAELVKAKPPTGGKLYDDDGRMRRWATASESRGVGLEPGDPAITKRPKKAKGGDWVTPTDDAEAVVVAILSGTLHGATGDPARGWYVPPVDPSTIAAHLSIFHELAVDAGTFDELEAIHLRHHEAATTEPFTALAVNHWHTKERPKL